MDKCQNQAHTNRHSRSLREPKAKMLRCREHSEAAACHLPCAVTMQQTFTSSATLSHVLSTCQCISSFVCTFRKRPLTAFTPNSIRGSYLGCPWVRPRKPQMSLGCRLQLYHCMTFQLSAEMHRDGSDHSATKAVQVHGVRHTCGCEEATGHAGTGCMTQSM